MAQCNVNCLPEKCADYTSSFGLKDKFVKSWFQCIYHQKTPFKLQIQKKHYPHMFYALSICHLNNAVFEPTNKLAHRGQHVLFCCTPLVSHSSQRNTLLHVCTHNTCNLSLLSSLWIIFLSAFRSDTLLVNRAVLVLWKDGNS